MTTANLNCRLCGTNAENGISIYGKQGQKLSMASVLIQHFNLLLCEDDLHSKNVCKKCWRITDQFHKLYCSADKYLTDLKDMLFKERLIEQPDIKKEDGEIDDVASVCMNRMMEDIKVPLDTDLVKNEEQFEDNGNNSLSDSGESRSTTEEHLSRIKKSSNRSKHKVEMKTKLSTLTRKIRNRNIADYRIKLIEEDKEIATFLQMKCEICNVILGTFTDLKRHYRNDHNMAGYVRCCDRQFYKRHRLFEHIQKHVYPTQYRCDLCGKIFNDKYYLNRHIKNHGLSGKPFKCNECPKRYESQKLLDSHFSQKHSDTPDRYYCDICNKSFTTKYSVAKHLLAMHTGERKSFICDICAKLFRCEFQLNLHYKKTHLGLGPPAVKQECPICGIWLSNIKGLRLHTDRIHEAKKQMCTICNKTCVSKQALAEHVRYAHSGKRYQCHLCDKIVKSQVTLKEHISTHTGVNLYKCEYCAIEFKSNANMYKHKRNVHPIQWQADRLKRLTLKKELID